MYYKNTNFDILRVSHYKQNGDIGRGSTSGVAKATKNVPFVIFSFISSDGYGIHDEFNDLVAVSSKPCRE